MSLGVAVIGCGMIGSLRAGAIARMRDPALRLVCDVEAARARALGARHGCEMETDWRRAVTRSNVDVVVVSTPNNSHAPITLQAIEAGKHVLCEKPLGRTPEECRDMVAAAAKHGVRLMTGFNHRWYPSILKVKALLEAGVIGNPIAFRGWIGHAAGPEFLGRWVSDAGMAGGGTLIDNGVHLVDLVRFLLGEVTHVQGLTRTAHWDIQSEDQALALLETEAGVPAFIMSSWTEWRGYRLWLQVHGSHGTVTAQYPPMMTVLDEDRMRNGRPARRWFLFFRDQVVERLRSYRWTLQQTFRHEIEELMAAIREGRSPRPDGYDGFRAVAIVHAIYESSQTGRKVALSVVR